MDTPTYHSRTPSVSLANWAGEAYETPVLTGMTPLQKWLIVLAAVFAGGVELGARFALNVILVDMQGNIAASSDEISWIVTSYSASMVCGIGLSSGLTRYLGVRNHYLFALFLYCTGVVGCFLSTGLWQLIFARVIMGAGGGVFLERAQVFLFKAFEGKQRGIGLIIFGLGIPSTGFVVLLGMGFVTDATQWKYAFLLLLPPMIMVAVIILLFFPRHVPSAAARSRVDVVGILLLIEGLTCLQIVASRAERDMWFESPLIMGCVVAGTLGFALWLWWDSREANLDPVLPLRSIFSNSQLTGSFSVALLVGAAMSLVLYVSPQYLRNIEGYSASQTALFLGVALLAMIPTAILQAKVLTPRFGFLAVVAMGFASTAIAGLVSIYCLTPTTPGWVSAALLAIDGFSLALLIAGIGGLALAGVPGIQVPQSVTAFRLVRQIGSVLGVAIPTVLIDRRMTVHSARLLDLANHSNATTSRTIAAYTSLVTRHAPFLYRPQNGSVALFQRVVVLQAQLMSYIDVFWFVVILAVLGLVSLFILRPAVERLVRYLLEGRQSQTSAGSHAE